nr:hypothetical protein BaRGS_017624 [Batillaria attramentaria]
MDRETRAAGLDLSVTTVSRTVTEDNQLQFQVSFKASDETGNRLFFRMVLLVAMSDDSAILNTKQMTITPGYDVAYTEGQDFDVTVAASKKIADGYRDNGYLSNVRDRPHSEHCGPFPDNFTMLEVEGGNIRACIPKYTFRCDVACAASANSITSLGIYKKEDDGKLTLVPSVQETKDRFQMSLRVNLNMKDDFAGDYVCVATGKGGVTWETPVQVMQLDKPANAKIISEVTLDNGFVIYCEASNPGSMRTAVMNLSSNNSRRDNAIQLGQKPLKIEKLD